MSFLDSEFVGILTSSLIGRFNLLLSRLGFSILWWLGGSLSVLLPKDALRQTSRFLRVLGRVLVDDWSPCVRFLDVEKSWLY